MVASRKDGADGARDHGQDRFPFVQKVLEIRLLGTLAVITSEDLSKKTRIYRKCSLQHNDAAMMRWPIKAFEATRCLLRDITAQNAKR